MKYAIRNDAIDAGVTQSTLLVVKIRISLQWAFDAVNEAVASAPHVHFYTMQPASVLKSIPLATRSMIDVMQRSRCCTGSMSLSVAL